MPLPDISLAQFNRIATGDYNAGQIDFTTKDDGTAELVKINNHVWRKSLNNVELSPERILEVKEAFLNALQKGGVSEEAINEIRDRLGLSPELDVSADATQRLGIIKARFSPLTRAQVRSILDEYANSGLGFTQESRAAVSRNDLREAANTANMSTSRSRTRDLVNGESLNIYDKLGTAAAKFTMTDAISLLSTSRSLADFEASRNKRCKTGNAVNERMKLHTAMVNSFQGLVAQALKLLPANVRETPEFKLAGETVKLVKDDNGNISAMVGKGALATKVAINMDADTFAKRLLGRVVTDAKTLGSSASKNILGMVYDRDLEVGLMATEKKSLTRQFACLILEQNMEDAVNLVREDYNTGILVELAERAFDGKDVGNTKAKLDAFHAKLVSDNADLPPEMKEMLGKVANIPLAKGSDPEGEFIVKSSIAGDINKVVNAMPQPVQAEPPKSLNDIGGLAAVKDFVANLVFSDSTMVGDAMVNKAGEAMRRMLSDPKNIVAFAEIIKNPALIDQACAPQIADIVKDGLGKMVDILDAEYKHSHDGKSLAVAATENDFVEQFSQFIGDPAKLRGSELAKFDNIILAMATKGCEKLQDFVNTVFKVDAGSKNLQGSLVNDPYAGMSAKDIKAQLDAKGLNQILDSASNADSPGQVGFFRQVISTYFTSLGKADKRSCFAAAMKYAQTFDFTGLEGDKLVSAQKNAVNKFTGAILKGTSPLLQKMMQGLPKEIMGDYADALDDMKSSLAPIPRKIVQAHFMKMIEESKDKGDGKEIESIELKKSLGAASVGEAFLCSFKLKGEKDPKNFVVKIMRHDAERRVKSEAEIFTKAANDIGPGMAKTWEGQLKQYMTEFDFRNEANNVNEGVKLYGIGDDPNHALNALAPDVHSMKMSTVVAPKKDVMVAEVADGKTVDKYFKAKTEGMRSAVSAVFEQNSATGRIKWEDGPIDPKTGKPKKVPVFKKDLPVGAIPTMLEYCRTDYADLKKAQKLLVQATKAWFHEALLGSGKFHGDTHAGNLMVGGGSITFIDFGNLYELKSDRPLLDKEGKAVIDPKTNQPATINERHELLRVIMGATFRDKEFVLKGFESLLSPAGKAALEANRDKAEAILDSVLSKGRFSYDMVYRLNAAVAELQKLGIELPPAINCFVQSMARLSNTMVEMNTILNQASELLEAANGYVSAPPDPPRDELDILGMAMDFRASPEGKVLVDDDETVVGLAKDGKDVQISAFCHHLSAEGFGEYSLEEGALNAGGSYYTRFVNRVQNAADPAVEARKLRDMLKANVDTERDKILGTWLTEVDTALATFETEIAAADTPEKKTAAVNKYASQYCSMVKQIFQTIQNSEGQLVHMRTFESVEKPSSFANAIMTTLMNNFDMLSNTFADSKTRLMADVYTITSSELKAGWFAGEDTRVQAIKDDALKMAGDDSYQIDIGV